MKEMRQNESGWIEMKSSSCWTKKVLSSPRIATLNKEWLSSSSFSRIDGNGTVKKG